MNTEFSVMIPTLDYSKAVLCKNQIPFVQNLFTIDNEKSISFYKLVNLCIQKAPTEIVIICKDMIRPHTIHFDKMLNFIHRGYGLVSLAKDNFYGFKKDLIRHIGFFDERYNDFCGFLDFNFRLKESNISLYRGGELVQSIDNKINKDNISYDFLKKKWRFENNIDLSMEIPNIIKRIIKEEDYSYDLGMGKDSIFLDFKHTVLN
jgi:hypothetical protein